MPLVCFIEDDHWNVEGSNESVASQPMATFGALFVGGGGGGGALRRWSSIPAVQRATMTSGVIQTRLPYES
jgi:hypothetical protein